MEIARKYAGRKFQLVLVARDADKLQALADDLTVRGASVSTVVADLDQIDKHDDILSSMHDADVFYLIYGSLPDQKLCEEDWSSTQLALHTNFISTASLLTRIAKLCEQRKAGSIVVVGSVAGDRGRGSNYVYGAAKGGLALFCAGLRNRLSGSNVNVLLVKPGFVDTPMTADIEKKPAILWASASRVAEDIVAAEEKGKSNLYTPWFWRYIMLIIKSVPENIFKRLSL
jgi:short-subunit dehydrogenase